LRSRLRGRLSYGYQLYFIALDINTGKVVSFLDFLTASLGEL
jgi:hypothetical protein